MLLTFVFFFLLKSLFVFEGSSGEVVCLLGEASREQPMTRRPKEEDSGEVSWPGKKEPLLCCHTLFCA